MKAYASGRVRRYAEYAGHCFVAGEQSLMVSHDAVTSLVVVTITGPLPLLWSPLLAPILAWLFVSRSPSATGPRSLLSISIGH